MATDTRLLQKNINSVVTQKLQPLGLQLDSNGIILNIHGDSQYYGLNLTLGEDAYTQLPFLFGLNLQEPHHFNFVSLGAKACADISLTPLNDHSYVVITNATVAHNTQQNIQQTANEVSILNYRLKQLGEELQQSNHSLITQTKQAEEANLVKSQFIAGMSHEFRTPIASILGYTQELEQKATGSRTSQTVQAIKRGGMHLLSMIDNLLDQGSLDEDQISLAVSSTTMSDFVTDIYTIFEPIAQQKNLVFSITETHLPTALDIDGTRVRQIVINLVTNALKYTLQGSVTLNLAWQDNTLTITVSDTGNGIALADQATIFTAYKQLQTNSESGVGLGLAITQQLINKMQGSIQLQSTLGVGSHFIVKIPAQQSQKNAVIATQQLSILLAEDDDDLADLFAIYLQSHKLVRVADGNAAIKQAQSKSKHFDIILLDMNLPLCKGYDVAQIVKAKGYSGKIIGMSASTLQKHQSYALAQGCDYFLVKPISADGLLSTIEQCHE